MWKIAPNSLSNPGYLLTFLWPAISSILSLSNTKCCFFFSDCIKEHHWSLQQFVRISPSVGLNIFNYFSKDIFFHGDMFGISGLKALYLKPHFQTEHSSLISLITQSVHMTGSSLGPVSDHSPQSSRRDLPSRDPKVNCACSQECRSGKELICNHFQVLQLLLSDNFHFNFFL